MHGIPLAIIYGVIRQLVETYFGNQDQQFLFLIVTIKIHLGYIQIGINNSSMWDDVIEFIKEHKWWFTAIAYGIVIFLLALKYI